MIISYNYPSPAHLITQAELDLIHQDESIGHNGLWPVQHHTPLDFVTPLKNHLARDVIRFDWGNRHNHVNINKDI